MKYTDLYPDETLLISTRAFREEADQFTYYVPNDPRIGWAIITAQGCGGMGANPGGGGVIVKSKVQVTPGEALLVQVGKCSTASVVGDSYVKRADNTVLVYADRGRGNGNGGLATNSTGQLKKDGFAASAASPNQGAPGGDPTIAQSQGFFGFGYEYSQSTLSQAADPGGGGVLTPLFDGGGNFIGVYTTDGAGTGSVYFEYYNNDPGPIDL